MEAHIDMGRIGEVYKQELKNTIYQICGRRDEQWEMINTRKDRSIAAFIQELNQHIRRQENQMCTDKDQDHIAGGRTQVYTRWI